MTITEEAPGATPVRGHTRRIVAADGSVREVRVRPHDRGTAPTGFATDQCPSTYRILAALRDPADQQQQEEEPMPAGWAVDPANPFRTLVPAPRCPHGCFARWAAAVDDKGRPNCKPCARTAAPAPVRRAAR